jgi:hypothetical protein
VYRELSGSIANAIKHCAVDVEIVVVPIITPAVSDLAISAVGQQRVRKSYAVQLIFQHDRVFEWVSVFPLARSTLVFVGFGAPRGAWSLLSH